MSRFRATLLAIAFALALTAVWVPAQTKPALADYFTEIPSTVIDPSYAPLGLFVPEPVDLNGDGHQDIVVLGANSPGSGVFNVPQPGRVLLGDGDGHFAPAPTDLFPIDMLMTVHPRKVLFDDFNADGRPDMFIALPGWDAPPFPGEQNRLYLSRAEGGWRDATANLPQLIDFSPTAAAGDISGRGIIEIYVGTTGGPIQPYVLLNTGSGQFTLTRTNIPVGNNQLLDLLTQHIAIGATLADLNDDGRSELIVTPRSDRSSDKLRRTTILWNRGGQFAETDTTELPRPATFRSAHVDYDAQRIDVNVDGLPDLVVIGSQTQDYGGWFVQILVNKGNRQFVDETADRVPPGEESRGTEGVVTTVPRPNYVRVLDFNQDGAPDFAVEFSRDRGMFTQDQPLVWLNNGAGHFSTLKVGDFVAPGREHLVDQRLVATRNGYSFIGLGRGNGLSVKGLLAKRKLPGVGR